MKKLVITLSIVLVSLMGYSQVTSVGEFRVANATTAFDVNLPVGTKVYNIETGDYWVATAGVISTATLSDASTSFTKLNDAGTDDQTAEEVVVTATGNITSTNVQSALEELQGDIDVNISDISTNTSNISTNASGITTNTGGITTNATNIATNATAIEGISDTDDQTAAEVNISDVGNYYTDTNVEGALQEVGVSIAAIETNVSTALSKGTVDETTYGITSDGGADDLILASATSTDAGVMTAAQYTKLDGIEDGAQVNLTMITDKFEEDDGTATAHPLSQTAITAQGAIVTINGVTLATSNYTLTASTLTLGVGVPVYQYDQVVITYFY